MTSIRVRLFVILLVTTGIVWLSAIGWIYASTQAQVEKVLDARLREAANMVNSLITDRRIDVASAVRLAVNDTRDFDIGSKIYQKQLSCQIWSLKGDLVGQSDGAPAQPLASHGSGFQQTVVNGDGWRVYTVINEKLGVRVLVGDSLAVRKRLVDNVIKGLLLPAGLILPVLAGLLWVSVGRGLLPLRQLANGLSQRSASDLHAVTVDGMARELLPVSGALNGLFQRLRASRERERNFTAYAAHELKTPLAGLRTQAQVALASDSAAQRERALARIIQGVDRTSRLVRQLLDLAEVEARQGVSDEASIALSDLIDDVIDGLASVAERRRVHFEISPALDGLTLHNGRSLLTVALRNIFENALQHAGDGEAVRCFVEISHAVVVLTVADDGPGMTDDQIMHAREKFYRADFSSKAGSGLGLSIVDAAAEALGGGLVLESGAKGGLDVRLSLPARIFRNA